MFNLKNASVVTDKYQKSGSTSQNFQLKLRQKGEGENDHQFTMSKALFRELGFETEKSAIYFPSYGKGGKINGVAFVIVPENSEGATIFQKRNIEGKETGKNPVFKHTYLVRGLVEAGVVDAMIESGKASLEAGKTYFMKLDYLTDIKFEDETPVEVAQGEGYPVYVLSSDDELKTSSSDEQKDEVSAEIKA